MEKTDRKKLNHFARHFLDRIGQLNQMQSSLTIAFYVMLSFFPILATISTIIPYFDIDIELVLDQFETILPVPIVPYILPVVSSILTKTHAGVLSLGIVASIWSASKCVKYLQNGMDRAYGIHGTRVFITSRLFSLAAFLLILVLLIAFMVIFTFGEPLLHRLIADLEMKNIQLRNFYLVKWLGTFVSLFLFFGALYFVLPNIKQRLRDVLPGALMAALAVLLLVQVYSWFLGIASNSLTAYGVLSAFFVLMIWIRMLSLVLLMGALLNSMLFEYRYGQEPQVRKSGLDLFLRKKYDALVLRCKKRVQQMAENRKMQKEKRLP